MDHDWVDVLQIKGLKYGDEVAGTVSGLMAFAGEVIRVDTNKAVIKKTDGGELTVHQFNLGQQQPRPLVRGMPAPQWITLRYCDNPHHPGRHRYASTEVVTIEVPKGP